MLVDPMTLRDLEIFQTRDGSPGLFQALDRTRTPGGSAALRERFHRPLSDPAKIRAVQETVAFVAREGVRFTLDPKLIRAAQEYLDAAWDVATRRTGVRFFLESVVVSVRYRALHRYTRGGVAATVQLLEHAAAFLGDLLRRDPPPELGQPLMELRSLVEKLAPRRALQPRRPWSLFRVDRAFRLEGRGDLQALLQLLAEVDALLAMGRVAAEPGFVIPEIVGSESFVLEGDGLVHPFLPRPVGNPVRVTGGETLVFLTGPNMAGKTTYLKAVSCASYLAHLGMPVPAVRFRISVLDALFTSLSPEESLRAGLSFFMAEVKRVREIAEALARGHRALVVFDEVFRGTNVKDALEASRLVILGFARSRGSGFIFSSHLVELAEELATEPSVRFAHFEGEIREGKTSYGYRLREGVSGQRFGLHLLEQEGVPALLRALVA